MLSTLSDHRRVFVTLGVGVMLVSAVRATRHAVIPLWAEHLTLGASTAALIYGVAAGIDMLVFYPAGLVMDRKGRRWVAVPSMITMGIALLIVPFTQGATALLLAACAIGFGNGIGSGMIMTIGADHSPRIGRAHFLGVWRLMSDIGSSCGPGVLSLLTAALSLGAGIAVIGAWRWLRLRSSATGYLGRGRTVPAEPRARPSVDVLTQDGKVERLQCRVTLSRWRTPR